MKKIISLLSVLIIALCTLTSCDEDVLTSRALRGVWQGDMHTYYEHSGRTQKYTYTEISFSRDIEGQYTAGTGYWTDYYYGGDYYRSRIFWEVKDDHIYITFRSSHTTIEIYKYDLSKTHFWGTFKDGANTYTDFDLTKIRDYEDYGDDDYYYDYAKKTRINIDSLNVKEIPVRKLEKK